MLSAVENFGPLVGPAVALSHHHHHHHPHVAIHPHHHHQLQAQHHQHVAERSSYALGIDAANIRVSTAALSPPTATAVAAAEANTNITNSQTPPLAHTQLTQLNALQAFQIQQQFQKQYEQHLNHLINASTQSSTSIAVLAPPPLPLPHRPQPQLAVTRLNEVDVALASHKQQKEQQQQKQQRVQQQKQNDHNLQQQQHQLRDQQQTTSVNLTRISSNDPKYMNSQRTTSKIMPLAEFAPPPKPLLKTIEQQHAITHENGQQSGPMNLVTNSNHTNYHLSSVNNCSNPASVENSRPSSSSSSVDVENDERMSPLSSNSGTHHNGGRKLLDSTTMLLSKQPAYNDASASSAAAAVVAAYQYNYSQVYGGVRPTGGLYNSPILFTSHNPHNVAHAVQHPSAVHGGSGAHIPTTYLGSLATNSPAMPLSEAGSIYSAEYLKALQNAVFQTTVTPQTPPLTTPVFQTSPLGKSNNTRSRLRSPAAVGVNPMITQASIASPPNRREEQRSATSKSTATVSSTATPTTTKLSTGTYLYEKAKRLLPDTPADSEKFFKIPSGKEGSLKHRILTRPANFDKAFSSANTGATLDVGKSPVMRTNNSTLSFKKGSYIELSNGSLRRVEDMRTEDFIQCAERSQEHQLIESTVVKINNNSSSNTVTIAFSYDRNQSKVNMEVSTDHPFFVYGQGWASCNPELSHKAFGLRCQRLQVGDICISLTKREPPNFIINNNKRNQNNNNNHIYNNISNNNNKHSYLQDTSLEHTATNETQCLENDLQPFILNEGTYATHLKTVTGVCPSTAQYPILRSPHGTVHFMPSSPLSVSSAIAPHPTYALTDSYSRFSFPPPTQAQSTAPGQAQQLHNSYAHQHCDRMIVTPVQSTKSPSNNIKRLECDRECEQLERQHERLSADSAESARKRRWSAPESFSNSDDDEETNDYQPPIRQKSAPNATVCSSYKPYLPTNILQLNSAPTTNAGNAGASLAPPHASRELNCDFLTTNYK